MKYELGGNINENISGIITLIVGIGVAVLVLIFVGTLGGQTYQLTQSKIAYSDINADCNQLIVGSPYCGTPGAPIHDYGIARDINGSIQSGFSALKTTGDYLPIIVVAIIIFMILGLVMAMGIGGMRQQGGQGAGML